MSNFKTSCNSQERLFVIRSLLGAAKNLSELKCHDEAHQTLLHAARILLHWEHEAHEPRDAREFLAIQKLANRLRVAKILSPRSAGIVQTAVQNTRMVKRSKDCNKLRELVRERLELCEQWLKRAKTQEPKTELGEQFTPLANSQTSLTRLAALAVRGVGNAR